MRPNRTSSYRRSRKTGWPVLPVLLAVLAVCGILTYIHKVAESHDAGSGGSSSLRRFLLAPSAHATLSVHDWFSDHVAAIVRGPQLAAQNTQLEQQVAMLTEQYRESSQDASENARLRNLLGFKAHTTLNLLPAEVIAVKPTAARDTITLMRGAHDHVQRLMPVISDTGALVGEVVDETYDTCDVLLLTDDESSAASLVYSADANVKPAEGICQGERSKQLNMIDIPQDADVSIGATVYTSGVGGVYPKGMVIGTVMSTQTDPAVGLKSAGVLPVVDFDHLQDVFIVLQAPTITDLPANTQTP